MEKRGYHDFPLKVFCPTMPKSHRGTLWCSRKFLESKNFTDRRGTVSRFSVQNVLSQSTEKLRRGTLLRSRKILVSKNVRDERGGRITHFPVDFFVSVPKNFVEEPFSVSLISGTSDKSQ